MTVFKEPVRIVETQYLLNVCVFVSKSVHEFTLKLHYIRYSLLHQEYNFCIGRNRRYKSKQISFVLNVLMMFSSLFSRSTMRTSSSMESWISSVTPTWWTLPWMYTGIYILTKKYPTVSGLASNALLRWKMPNVMHGSWLHEIYINLNLLQLSEKRELKLWLNWNNCNLRQSQLWRCLRTQRQWGRCSQQGKCWNYTHANSLNLQSSSQIFCLVILFIKTFYCCTCVSKYRWT